ncbi:YhcH/YjgK/YiaL family protein [Paenibacillus sp. FA6]|uniref:YhcH/YjgK/YiaL family protein n=1 Tax=Paenibacillus sp. FA6 TaxID=3413029 RepID=UPI003F654E3C
MIIDRLSNAKMYTGIHPRLAEGLKYLMETDFHSVEPGKYEIEGSHIFALVQEYETSHPDQGRWESHYRYTDIQYMFSGEERMGYANKGHMSVKKRDEDKDIMFLEGTGDLLNVHEGAFCIFTPNDVHMPTIMINEPRKVKKVVIKVLMD